MIKLGHCELRQQLPCLDVIADIDVALDDIAGGAGVDFRGRERSRRGRQDDRHGAGARLHGRDAHPRHEIARLLRGRHDLLVL